MIKVLAVEDDTFLMTVYKTKLVKEGFELQTAGDGEKALEILQTFRPDVIVMDLVMPRKDGFAALQEIKAQPALKDIPVIIATNLAHDDEVARVMALGAADCIVKSDLSLEELVNKIKALAA